MGLGDFHNHRRLFGALALVGAVLYSALIPAHIVSQAVWGPRSLAPAAYAEVTDLAPLICHRGSAAAEKADSPAPSQPAAPEKKCPFCTGYAAFVAATICGAEVGILPVETASLVFNSFGDVFVGRGFGLPQNRGPPLGL